MARLFTQVFIILLWLLTSQYSLLAQDFNTPFLHYKEFQKADSNKLFLRFENFNFVKNNEYSGTFSNGTTWIGYSATPKLVYYPSSKIRIEAGVRFQQYSGRTNFNETQAIFSVNYQASSKVNLILGGLNQNNNHMLSEPMFEPEKFFTDKAESGIQLLYHTKRLKLDTWINWEQFILKGDPFQEKFTFGISSSYQLNNTSSQNRLSIPVQILFAHRGGEIDSSDESVQTIGNFSSGLDFLRKVENSRFTSWYIRALAYYVSDNSSVSEFLFNKGHAFYPQIGINTKHSQFRLGYWYAYHFIASRGSELFQSISYSKPGSYQNRRELVTFKYFYERKISKGIHLGGKIDLYYNPVNSNANYATAIYLRINGDFFLKKISWN
ncbi:hypothetical protein [Labilibaculum euxinus]|uniref:Porin n=1 Tax=Labilibaculum euxinus TaxID=2686357 RepID=A0A7M4D4X0_9BACT|nr:hypothetical protein [Labilibaculum euxinus]MUP37699.1 hypothetical protein [Labilibaculum euxinus]MVB06904.1 hypothetical protein [Labilibaculum euxinus]